MLNYDIHRNSYDTTLQGEIFNLFVSAVETCQEIYTIYPQYVRNRISSAPEVTFLGPYILHQYRRTGAVRTDVWLKTRIQNALSPDNPRKGPFFDLLLTTELPFVAILWQKPEAALEVLEMFFDSSDEEINRKILSFLARLRVHYPDAVDDFLEEQHASYDFRLQVQTNEPAETIGELIGENAWYFLRDEVILKSPELRSQLIRMFEKAANCKDLKTWLDYLIRELINQIYGRKVL